VGRGFKNPAQCRPKVKIFNQKVKEKRWVEHKGKRPSEEVEESIDAGRYASFHISGEQNPIRQRKVRPHQERVNLV
jgi:hypothetical protein